MAKLNLNRRELLARGATLFSLYGLPILATEAAGAAVCTPDYSGDKAQRDSLHYKEQSTDPNRACETCQYFESRGKCGNCRIFNCSVNPNGTCDSWSKKTD